MHDIFFHCHRMITYAWSKCYPQLQLQQQMQPTLDFKCSVFFTLVTLDFAITPGKLYHQELILFLCTFVAICTTFETWGQKNTFFWIMLPAGVQLANSYW